MANTNKISLTTYLLHEAPIGDYQTFGDFKKRHSVRDKRDRMLMTHPRSVERLKKKFENTEYMFNLFFVNTPQAKDHMEVGLVKLDWVRQNLGDEVADAIAKTEHEDAISIVFTNNNGSERMPFTAWIAAHRIGHAFAREKGRRSEHNQYRQASNHLINQLSQIMECYGDQNFPHTENKLSGYSSDERTRSNQRVNQLTLLHFFQQVATFKSAREGNVRDWFEILNELIAQYLTTGRIKFNKPPKSFGGKARKYYLKNEEEANDLVETLARDMQYMIDDIMGSLCNQILVM